VLRPDTLKVALHSRRQNANHTTLAPVNQTRACSMTDLVAFESQRAMDMLLLVLCWNTLYRCCSICQLVKGGNCLGALRFDVKHACTWLRPAVCTQPLPMGTPGDGTVMTVVLLLFAAETLTGDSINAVGPKPYYAYGTVAIVALQLLSPFPCQVLQRTRSS
jgi:hypothetical protein